MKKTLRTIISCSLGLLIIVIVPIVLGLPVSYLYDRSIWYEPITLSILLKTWATGIMAGIVLFVAYCAGDYAFD